MSEVINLAPGKTESFFILGADRVPKPATQVEWETLSVEQRLVGETEIGNGAGIVRTAFGGVDVDFGEHSPPYLFETTSLVGDDGCQEGRWRTWEEAEQGHAAVVQRFERLFERGTVVPLRP